MARRSMKNSELPVPDVARQVRFHQLLVAARKTWLADALNTALGEVEPSTLKSQLLTYVPRDAQRILARAGIRDEHVFPTPIVLEAAPTLIGYYRMLLGVPQKSFYGSGSGMGPFKAMERMGTLTDRQREKLPAFCHAMSAALAELVRQISPVITPRDVAELPLLTFGAFLQGANNVSIGRQATESVFHLLAELIEPHITSHEERAIRLTNSAGRQVVLTLSADPDVRIEEEVGGTVRKKVAIEIKGGTDKSNAHNRAGEAEKSHQKAKHQGFREFWTLIASKGVNTEILHAGSPTTTEWFDISQILGRVGQDWEKFRFRLAEVVGIPLE